MNALPSSAIRTAGDAAVLPRSVGQWQNRRSPIPSIQTGQCQPRGIVKTSAIAEKGFQGVLAENKKWAESLAKNDKGYFEELASGQAPEFLWIGCSDSRAPPNVMLNLPPGAVFVHRNIGNQAALRDLNCMSVVEYAVSNLKVKHVILCGHTNCGAVAGSLAFPPDAPGVVNLWLADLKDTAQHHAEMIYHEGNDKEKTDTLAELNVRRQVHNLVNSPPISGAWKEGRDLSVHGVMYRIETGMLEPLASVSSSEEARDFEV